ncbi:TetR family transcriptional regulator [Kineosporia babensis]|uniref:TetR family transcriptional regulator n=1 Tax=Kineosporia babensis TaxID=499548 RepID=A0A9X1NIV9_9ACTN|nr:TetR family transcriptional regulator [Kineosporia babensis]MCD5314978.1 TetR family transcriptional regulator [Kineosporia babensis]
MAGSGSPSRRSKADVADMALKLLDEHGLPDLTMRNLAGALGVQPSALYWHFPNKQALLAAVSSRILAPVHEVDITNLAVPAAVLVVGGRMHECLLAYRDASELVSSSLALGLVESPVRPKLLAAARAQAVPDALADVAAAAVVHFVVGFTFHEQQRLVADALGLLESEQAEDDDFTSALTMIAEGLETSIARLAQSPV